MYSHNLSTILQTEWKDTDNTLGGNNVRIWHYMCNNFLFTFTYIVDQCVFKIYSIFYGYHISVQTTDESMNLLPFNSMHL